MQTLACRIKWTLESKFFSNKAKNCLVTPIVTENCDHFLQQISTKWAR